MPDTPGNEQEVVRESRQSGSLLLPRLPATTNSPKASHLSLRGVFLELAQREGLSLATLDSGLGRLQRGRRELKLL